MLDQADSHSCVVPHLSLVNCELIPDTPIFFAFVVFRTFRIAHCKTLFVCYRVKTVIYGWDIAGTVAMEDHYEWRIRLHVLRNIEPIGVFRAFVTEGVLCE